MLQSFSGRGDHFDNFVRAVRGRRLLDLHADIEQGHLSSALCHLANVSYRLGNSLPSEDACIAIESFPSNDDCEKTFQWTLKHLAENGVSEPQGPAGDLLINVGRALIVNKESEAIEQDPEANALLMADYREPFVIPPEFDTTPHAATSDAVGRPANTNVTAAVNTDSTGSFVEE
jgi:hypothetical protein